jgi:cytochrome c biogenesis protein CcmG, thiol:disulfide interchange protein DsbE
VWQAERQADDGSRTRDLELGKLALYQLSYVRVGLILRRGDPAGRGRRAVRSNLLAPVSVRSSIAVLAVLAVVGLLVYGLASKGSSRIQVGEVAPVKTLPQLAGGGKGSLSDYRGRWVLVNFWASWCVPCRDEAPALEQFQRRHGGSRFTVLGIDTQDLSGDGEGFARRYGLSYPQLHDGEGKAADEYGTTGVPENFLVAPSGKVELVQPGPVTEEYLREQVEPLLPEQSS